MMKRYHFYSLIIVIAVIVIYAVNSGKIGITQAPVNTNVMYPDKALTPGDTFQTATKDQVCVPGYTKTVRDVPLTEKKQVYSEYNVSYPQPSGAYEVDHFIPLTLGGSNDIKNLWLEGASPTPGFHQKDEVELYLHNQVCDGNISLQEAQNEIRIDWYSVYKKIPKTNYNTGTLYK